MRELTDLLAESNVTITGRVDRIITGITYDSRATRTGNIFFALRGEHFNGHKFVKMAIENGASVIVHDQDLSHYDPKVTYIRVPDARAIMPHLAAEFYRFPAEEMLTIGITGTNGKTTTTYYIQHLLAGAHLQAAIIGTTGVHWAGQVESLTHTTPESVDLQAILADLAVHGCSSAVMEVSSHALMQHRADDLFFNAAIFTNLTQDHLDYHATMEAYARAKQVLFNQLSASAVAVINSDDPYGELMVENSPAKVVRFGQKSGSEYRLAQFELHDELTHMAIKTPKGDYEFDTNAVGLYNGYNLLAAISVVMELGYEFSSFAHHLGTLPIVPGRLQQIGKTEKRVFIDYAHTPNAMETVLEALRSFYPSSRLITVFGCGGDRDKGKRPKMGEIATTFSEYTIITDDNPRSESAEAIIRDIIAGCDPQSDFEIIPHRKGAIQRALTLATDDTIVAVLGKGHENYQEIRGTRYHFNDTEAIQSYQDEDGN